MHYDVISCVICISNEDEYLEEGSYINSSRGYIVMLSDLCNGSKKKARQSSLHRHLKEQYFRKVRPQQLFSLTDHFIDLAATWLDESFYLVSKDIVESILNRRDTLVCNIWESQSIGYWLKNISNLKTFSDNKRLLYLKTPGADKRREICHSLIGIHKSYPEKMRTFWGIYEKEAKPLAYQVPPITYNCKNSIWMDIMAFKHDKFWFCGLKLCKDNPIWNPNREYKGAQGS